MPDTKSVSARAKAAAANTPLRIGLLFGDQRYDVAQIAKQLAPHTVEAWPMWREWSADELLRRCRSVDAVVTGRSSPKLPEALISDRGKLRLLAHLHGTVRHLASKAHIEAGLLVTNWGENVANVAEGSLTLLLACLKQVHGLDGFVRSKWKTDDRLYQDHGGSLIGMDVGVYGYGPVGRHLGRFLQALGSRVAIYDPYAKNVPASVRVCASLRDLFSTCSAVSVNCGLNDATRGSVTRELLDLLPQGGVLVNTARGPIVREADLAAALATGRIMAGIDVIEDERGWERSPLSPLASSRVLLTGHMVCGSKGPDPDTRSNHRVALPPHAVEPLMALGRGEPVPGAITVAEYDLKT